MSTLHVGSGSSSDAPFACGSRSPRKVNESVYKFDRPQDTPTLQILFFHGLQFDDSLETHVRNWESRDRSLIWPEKWLVEDFPTADILYISYDGLVKKGSHLNESLGMYIIAENLMSDLIQAGVGQIWNCPVIMVGHCFGGMVIKELCLHAHKARSDPTKRKMFLDNVRGIFNYSTPHHGSDIFERVGDMKHPLWSYFRVLSTEGARLNHEFDHLCKLHGWIIRGIGAGLRVPSGRFKGLLLVKESSARGGESFSVREADHFAICKPESKTSSGYYELKELLRSIHSSIRKATRLIHGLPTYPTDLERRWHEVQVKLAQAPVVGIVGMGGIGKTTIAKELYNNISRNFEYACFTETVTGIQKHEVEKQILGNFHRRGTRVEKNQIEWSDLEKTKTLIVLDGVDHKQIIPLPDLDFFGEGSRLIITSRDQGVLDVFANRVIYDVEFLIDDEAKKLFCRHTFGEDGIPDHLLQANHHLNENVEGVVKKCGGLPLTLEVTGCYLRRHMTNANVWKQTIEKLGKAQSVNGLRDDRVWSSLKVSYDGLDSDLQGMFVEAGTYFFGQRVQQALAAWSTAYGNSDAAWAILLSTSMVKEIDRRKLWNWPDDKIEPWDDGKVIWVHEHLRDLANNLSTGATVSMCVGGGCAEVDLLNVVKSETKHLRIVGGLAMLGPTKIRLEMLDKLEELKYLELHYVPPEGLSTNLPKKLSLLIWKYHYEGDSLPISLKGMNNLAVLELSGCTISEESIDTLGTLTNLRTLSLQYMKGLHRLPENLDRLSQLNRLELSGLETLPHSIGHLRALEHLVLDCRNFKYLPDSFGNLSSLATLQMNHCNRLRSLPDSFGRLTSLTTFQIQMCEMLDKVPETFGALKALKTFWITKAKRLKALPESLGNLSALTYLSLVGCEILESLPASFGMPSSLEELELRELERLDTVPKTFGDLKALKRLVIADAKRLKSLPESFGNLPALTDLHLEGCEILESLPASFGMLSSLEELELRELERLDTVPKTFGDLKALKRLVIADAKRLKSLPESFGNLPALTDLHLEGCEILESLPASFGMLSSLEELELRKLERLDTVPKTFGDLKALKRLVIADAKRLKSLPESFGNLYALTDLRLKHCESLESLPASFGMLSSLEELELRELERLDTVPKTFGDVKALKRLVIAGAKRLKSLPESFGNLYALTDLRLERCESLESLPASFGMLSSLEELELHQLERIDAVPKTFGDLKALKRLVIAEAKRLKSLPESFGNLYALTDLWLRRCESLESLPASFGMLSSLEELVLGWVERLDTVPKTFGDLKALKRLVIAEAKRLKSLPESFGNLYALTDLRLIRCESLESLPASFGMLSSLEELELRELERLDTVPKTFGDLKALKRLVIADAKRLKSLPESFGNLYALIDLRLERCESLESLPASFGMLSSLEELVLGAVERLDTVPETFGDLKALTKVDIMRATRLKALPESFGNLSALKYLCLHGCDSLKKLPTSFGNLSSLVELKLNSCDQLLLETLGHLKALKTLELLWCNYQEVLPDSLGTLSSLTTFEMRGERLQTLPRTIGLLHSLTTLRIVGSSLSSIPEELGNLSSLAILLLQSCHRIETLPDGLGRISSLRRVILNDCPKLKNVPDSWGEDLAPREDRSIETRRTERGQCSQNACAYPERIRLFVARCPFLSDRELRRLGWIEFNPGSSDHLLSANGVHGYSIMYRGRWYQRQGPLSDHNVPLKPRNEVRTLLTKVVEKTKQKSAEIFILFVCLFVLVFGWP